MTKNRNSTSKIIDALIFVLCLSTAVFFLNLFWKDLNKMLSKNETPIATISYKRNNVQRKFQEKLAWDRIQENGFIYDGDTIRTTDDSEATITFPDGKVLDIFESSMVCLVMDKDKGLSVELSGESSRILANTKESTEESKISIISKQTGSKIELKSGSVISASAAPQGKELQVQVDQGKALIVSKTGENIEADAGTAIAVDNEGKTRKTDLSVKFPPLSHTILNQENKSFISLPFEWKKNSDFPVKIELSFEKNFKTIETSYIFEHETEKLITLPSKNIYWRATPVTKIDNNIKNKETGENYKNLSAEKIDSIQGKIIVLNAPPPVLTRPENNQFFYYKTKLPKIHLTWNGNDIASSYFIEISDSYDFSKTFFSKQIQGCSTFVQNLPEGKWYWRIIPSYNLNKTGKGIASNVQSFEIIKKDKLDVPVLLIPQNNATDFLGNSINFSWKTINDAKNYNFVISKQSDLSNSFINKTILENYNILDTSNLEEGTYYWAVRQIDFNEEKSEFSEIRSFKIEKAKPLLVTKLIQPSDNYTCAKNLVSKIDFIWTKTDEISLFQISQFPDFETILFSKTTQNSSVSGIQLEEGKYYWRVGNSAPKSFIIQESLENPKLVAPEKDQIMLSEKNIQIQFSWQPIPKADYYKFTLKELSANQEETEIKEANTIVLNKIKDNFVQVFVSASQEKLKQYEWSVQAFKEESENSSAIIGKPSFSYFYARSPNRIIQSFPKNEDSISGLDALLNELQFKWISSDAVETQNFILEKEEIEDGKITKKTIATISCKECLATVTGLEPGKYWWKIIAVTPGNSDISTKDEWSFTVKDIPPLSKPILKKPAEKTVFGADYLRKFHTINFEWEKVPLANEYIFTISKKDSKSPLIQRKMIQNKIEIDILDIDLASFEWTVQAFRKNKNGKLIQQSECANSSFKIELPKPKQVQALDMGIQYGE